MTEIEFDDDRALSYAPRHDFEKVAIFVRPVTLPVVISAPFGEQVMRGGFYVVADEAGSYAAAQAEFEATHERIGPSRWRKVEGVRAYRLEVGGVVSTIVGAEVEGCVEAAPGDWLVRQHGGEVMVMTDSAFADRYGDNESRT